ncbi:MAG: sugar ABC transporter permease [Lachnospiraceae bacterium]|jgi:ABC-type sugar transport system permease subunit|nr:sugar ABC transporter permease [Lachnospiraceae bacterium]
MKKQKWFMVRFLAPAVLVFLAIFLYPCIRTLMMSVHKVEFVTDSMSEWTFTGLENFKTLFASPVFIRSLINVLKIWIGAGAAILGLAMLFSVMLTSNIKGKQFWKAVLYLPSVISAVALVTMWLQYVFNNQYGLFKTLFETLHWDKMAQFQWTSPDHLFLSMMIAFTFGSVGFYVLIFVAGIDGISKDYYEAATIDGAGAITKFLKITVPLLKDTIKRSIVLYTAGALGFFVYSSLFSLRMELSTVTPIVYMYENVFGSSLSASSTELNVGMGAAVGVIVTLVVLIVNLVLDKLIKSEKN